MKKRVLLTGGTGFVGRNILPVLRESYDVLAPTRAELDVWRADCVDAFLAKNPVDFLVHCAICTPANPLDDGKDVLESVLRSFLNFKKHKFEKIVYIGSGAEYGKDKDIVNATEDDIGKRLPADEYGLAKYVLNDIARHSGNIYNLRIFGCYGANEPERRFIRHAIDRCLKNEPVTIRRDCGFSYVFVKDLGRAAVRLLSTADPAHHDYTICDGRSLKLSEIAEIVRKLTGAEVPVQVLDPVLNNEYTGSNARFLQEFPDFSFTRIDEGIKREIEWFKGLDL